VADPSDADAVVLGSFEDWLEDFALSLLEHSGDDPVAEEVQIAFGPAFARQQARLARGRPICGLIADILHG